MSEIISNDAMPIAVFGTPGVTTVNLLDLLTQVYGEKGVHSIDSVALAYVDKDYLAAQNSSYWNPNNPVTTKILGANGQPIPNAGQNQDGTPAAHVNILENRKIVPGPQFQDYSISVGNNIFPNVFVEVLWANNGPDIHTQTLAVASVPEQFKTAAAYSGKPTPGGVVAMAEQFAAAYAGVVNVNDCHRIAADIAAAAGATLDADTSMEHFVNNNAVQDPQLNEEGGFWRIAYRASDYSNPAADWQTLVQPGDIVRMDWADGGVGHTVTVTAGLNDAGQIRVVDNNLLDAQGRTTIGEHWVDYDDLTRPQSITIYRLSPDQRYLIDDTKTVGGAPNAFDDQIIGTAFNDDIRLGAGTDTVHGSLGDDLFTTGSGVDALWGDEGNDTFIATYNYNFGFHSFDGGQGIDTVDYSRWQDAVRVSLHFNAVWTTDNTDLGVGTVRQVASLASIENIIGGAGNDELLADNTTDSHRIAGGDGNDRIHGGEGNDILFGGADSFAKSTSFDGDDTIYGEGGNDLIQVQWGNDVVYGGTGSNTLSFSWLPGGVTVDLSAGQAAYSNSGTLYDASGNPYGITVQGYTVTWQDIQNIIGTSFNDVLTGDDNANTLESGLGSDKVYGMGGNDTLVATFDYDNTDLLDGGGGTDTVDFSAWQNAAIVDLSANAAWTVDDTNSSGTLLKIANLVSIENVTGGAGSDEITGDNGPNVIVGNAGDDVIHGGGGNDILTGGFDNRADATGQDGNDTIWGDGGDDLINVLFGNDVVHGGTGNNTLSFAEVNTGLTLDLASGSTTYSESKTITDDSGNFKSMFGGVYTVTWDGIQNVIGGRGDDVITGDGNDNILDGGSGGNDVIHGGGGNDTLAFAEVKAGLNLDLASGQTDYYGSEVTYGPSGNFQSVTIKHYTVKWDGIRNLTGGSGDDVITGDGNDNILDGGSGGNDVIHGGGGNDTLAFAEVKAGLNLDLASGQTDYYSSKVTYGPSGNFQSDTINHYIVKWDGIRNLTGGSGDDVLTGDSNNNTLDGGDGTDTAVFHGPRSDYTITPLADGSIQVADSVAGRDGTDLLKNIENLRFTKGELTATQVGGQTQLVKLQSVDGMNVAFADPSTAAAGFRYALAGTGVQAAFGSDGNDVLDASGTADYHTMLYGGAGKDTLIAGSGGSYTLQGGADDDTAVFAGNQSDYTIDGSPAGWLSWATVTNKATGAVDWLQSVEHLQFADGTIDTPGLPPGGSFNSVLFLDSSNPPANIGSGYDIVYVDDSHGPNPVHLNLAGTNVNFAYGGLGSDVFDASGVSSAVSLWGQWGNDVLIGGSGNDWLMGDEWLPGGGNDWLDGGAGNDWLDGGNGDDTFVFRPGSGMDTVEDFDQTNSDSTNVTYATVHSNDHDVIRFEGGLFANFDALVASGDMTQSGVNVVIKYGATDQVTMLNVNLSQLSANDFVFDAGSTSMPTPSGVAFDGTTFWGGSIQGTAGVDTVSYANANYAIYVDLAHGYSEALTSSPDPKEQLTSIENITGAPNNLNYLHGDQNDNVLIGGNNFNWFEGGGGNNTLIGGTGTDLADYLGTNGPVTIDLPVGKVCHGNYVDTLSSIEQFRGTTFGDTFTGDAANDYYVSLGGNAKIYGGTGNNWFEVYSGDNTMVGGSGNDKLVAGTGSDVLTGGGGANTFVIGAHGAGHTEITDFNAAAGDRIDFSQDALVKQMSDLTVSDDGHGNAMVSYSASDGTGTIVLDQVAPTAVSAVDFLHFTPPPSGQTFDGTAFWGGTLTGTPGVGDTASFASANTGIYVDLTSGLAETDDLSKTEHLISIENVTGSLTGMNTLIGDDRDNILTGGNNFNWLHGGGGNDTLIGGSGISLADYLGAGGPVTIDLPAGKVYHDNFVDTVSHIQQFRGTTFGDTFKGDAADDYYVSEGGNAKIYGGAGNNWFEVYSGDNMMVGGSGNDKLVAGTGNDVITGGSGADTFVIGAHGAGRTEITDFNLAAGDRIDFGQDASVKQMSDLSVSDDGHGNAMLSYSASDGNGTVVLDNVAPTAVTAADFLHFTLPPSGEVAADQTIILDSTFSGTVNFLSDTGMLKLENSLSFAGTVAGLRGQDAIDLADIGFGESSTLGYSANADNSGGSLSVGDGTHMANIALLGSYMASTFAAASDGHGGTLISEATHASTQTPVVTQPHA